MDLAKQFSLVGPAARPCRVPDALGLQNARHIAPRQDGLYPAQRHRSEQWIEVGRDVKHYMCMLAKTVTALLHPSPWHRVAPRPHPSPRQPRKLTCRVNRSVSCYPATAPSYRDEPIERQSSLAGNDAGIDQLFAIVLPQLVANAVAEISRAAPREPDRVQQTRSLVYMRGVAPPTVKPLKASEFAFLHLARRGALCCKIQRHSQGRSEPRRFSCHVCPSLSAMRVERPILVKRSRPAAFSL